MDKHKEKMAASNIPKPSASITGLLGLDADCAGYKELTLRERLLEEKSRIQRDASQRIRRINNALTELENTDAEEVVSRAQEVLRDVG